MKNLVYKLTMEQAWKSEELLGKLDELFDTCLFSPLPGDMRLQTPLSLLLALANTGFAAQDPRVQVSLTLQHPVNGVATTPEGRLFVLYARVDGSTGPTVAEWHNGSDPTPYPNLQWNSFTAGSDPTTHLIRINSLRIGPDGTLWLVDTGSPSFGQPVILPEGPKLVQVNVTLNTVKRVYNLGSECSVATLQRM
jgi:hypothetical protein